MINSTQSPQFCFFTRRRRRSATLQDQYLSGCVGGQEDVVFTFVDVSYCHVVIYVTPNLVVV